MYVTTLGEITGSRRSFIVSMLVHSSPSISHEQVSITSVRRRRRVYESFCWFVVPAQDTLHISGITSREYNRVLWKIQCNGKAGVKPDKCTTYAAPWSHISQYDWMGEETVTRFLSRYILDELDLKAVVGGSICNCIPGYGPSTGSKTTGYCVSQTRVLIN